MTILQQQAPISLLLSQWYGDPMPGELAIRQAEAARNRINRKGQFAVLPYLSLLQQMIADWWLSDNSSVFPGRGILYASSRRKMALYHLVAGQLLISCRLESAMDYLDMGLRHADGLLGSNDYFELYNRHEELRFLKLSATRQQPRSLAELLNESRVMRKLAPRSRYSIPK